MCYWKCIISFVIGMAVEKENYGTPLLLLEHIKHQVRGGFHTKKVPSAWWTLTGCSTIKLSSDTNCLEWAQTSQVTAQPHMATPLLYKPVTRLRQSSVLLTNCNWNADPATCHYESQYSRGRYWCKGKGFIFRCWPFARWETHVSKTISMRKWGTHVSKPFSTSQWGQRFL